MFTYIYMTLSLFFVSHAEKAAAEIHRTLMPNGTAFITTRALLGYVPLLQPAQQALRLDIPL
jgi:hypothetical protein